jgi:hypothetical protein
MRTIIIFKNSHNNIDWRLERQTIPSGIILGIVKAKGALEIIDFDSIEIVYVNEFYTTKRGLMIQMKNSINEEEA